MRTSNSEQFRASRAKQKQILLLADDGRMVSLLRRSLRDYRVKVEMNVIDGIMRLGQARYDAVLLNADALGNKTPEAVQALRHVGGQALRLLLYSEPFTEVHARAAVSSGADDYLIWPVPAGELREQLEMQCHNGQLLRENSTSRRQIATEHMIKGNQRQTDQTSKEVELRDTGRQVSQAALLAPFQNLARLVPEGKTALVEQAEKTLAQILGAAWVRIFPARTTAGSEPQQALRESLTSWTQKVILKGLLGISGEMLIGPTIRQMNNRAALAEQAGAFVATLLYLAERDENLKRLATVDELTGAYNRRYLEHFLRQVIEQSTHEHTEVTLLLFDIDEFKHYNDTYGHAAGDEVLRQATKLMRRCCRSHDVVARMGGDEFAVLFWDTGQRRQKYEHSDADAIANGNNDSEFNHVTANERRDARPGRSHPEMVVFLSNRFRRRMRTSEFPCLGPEARGVLTISGGLAGYPWDGYTVEELLAQADNALRSAKQSGKNRIYLVGQPAKSQA